MQDNRKRILTFLLLTFSLSGVFYYLIISGGGMAHSKLLVAGLMWMPGVSAILTQVYYARTLRGLGWAWGHNKYNLQAYLLPIAYAFATYGLLWATGLVQFQADWAVDVLHKIGLEGLPKAVSFALAILLVGIMGTPQSMLTATGEEIGWRGFLTPHLAKETSYLKTSLIVGSIWSVWHYPILIWGGYNNGTEAWFGLLCFTVMVIGITFAFTWFRMRGGSLWSGALIHASHNLYIQGICDPSCVNTGIAKYLTGEFGAALAVTAVIMAYLFWRKRDRVAAHFAT